MKSNEKLKSHKELKLMTDYEKLNAAFALLLIIGFIMLFINWKIALLLFALSIGIITHASKKYPEEHKKFMEQNNSKHNIKPEKKYSIIHIQGLKNQDNNQKCKIISYNDALYFYTDKENLIESIEKQTINNVSILEKIETNIKEKSVIGRAVVGGLILGPVGAIVGGISGASPSYQANKTYYIEIKTSSKDIIFAVNGKEAKEIKEKILN